MGSHLFRALQARGWRMREGTLYAPRETMWLSGGAEI